MCPTEFCRNVLRKAVNIFHGIPPEKFLRISRICLRNYKYPIINCHDSCKTRIFKTGYTRFKRKSVQLIGTICIRLTYHRCLSGNLCFSGSLCFWKLMYIMASSSPEYKKKKWSDFFLGVDIFSQITFNKSSKIVFSG